MFRNKQEQEYMVQIPQTSLLFGNVESTNGSDVCWTETITVLAKTFWAAEMNGLTT
jgi:hypothetical protein